MVKYTFDDAVDIIDNYANRGRLTTSKAREIIANTTATDRDAVRDYIVTLRTGYEHTASKTRILGKLQ